MGSKSQLCISSTGVCGLTLCGVRLVSLFFPSATTISVQFSGKPHLNFSLKVSEVNHFSIRPGSPSNMYLVLLKVSILVGPYAVSIGPVIQTLYFPFSWRIFPPTFPSSKLFLTERISFFKSCIAICSVYDLVTKFLLAFIVIVRLAINEAAVKLMLLPRVSLLHRN